MMRLGSGRIIFCIAACAAVGLVLVTSLLVYSGYRDAIANAEVATQAITAVAEENILRTIETSDVVASIVLEKIARGANPREVAADAEFTRQVRRYAEHLPARGIIWIVDERGRIIWQSERENPERTIDFSDREWFEAHSVLNKESHVGEAVYGRLNRELFFTYGRRINLADGSFGGVVLVSLRPVFFHASLFQPEYQAGGAVTLLRNDGATVARSPFKEEMMGRRTAHARLFNDFAGQAFGTYWSMSLYENAERLISFRRLETQPLTVLASIRTDAVFGAWRSSAILHAALLALTLLIIAALAWLGVRTARREQESRRALMTLVSDREMLFAETHHRIKNNLAMVGSLIRLHSRRLRDGPAREVLQSAENRITSIGLVHDMLHQLSPGSQVKLEDYLPRVIHEVAASYGADERAVRVTSLIAPVAIDSDRAIPLAIVLAEVISNAFKHAFREQGGELRVSLESDGDTIQLEIRDTGPGLPSEIRKDSLGAKLIASLATQMGATHEAHNDHGAVLRFSVPVKGAQL